MGVGEVELCGVPRRERRFELRLRDREGARGVVGCLAARGAGLGELRVPGGFTVRLLDFGLALLHGGVRSRHGRLIGRFVYHKKHGACRHRAAFPVADVRDIARDAAHEADFPTPFGSSQRLQPQAFVLWHGGDRLHRHGRGGRGALGVRAPGGEKKGKESGGSQNS